MPKVSVCVPAYNAEKTIANAINSILNQTEKDFELIIINDGSTDNTEEVVMQFKDERIMYYKTHHQGIVGARNFGNNLAKADILAMQDADDLSLPDRLEKCYNLFKTDRKIDVLYHGLYANMWSEQFNCIARGYVPAQPFDKVRLLKEQYIPGACVFKKECWVKKPFRYETQFAFDFSFHLEWAFSGFKYKALDIGLYEYVRHANSASITYEKDGRRQQSLKALKEIAKKEYNIELCL